MFQRNQGPANKTGSQGSNSLRSAISPSKIGMSSSSQADRSSNIDLTQKDQNNFQLKWATNLQVIFGNRIVETADQIITKNLNNIRAALVYTNYPDESGKLSKQLNSLQQGIAEEIKNCQQIQKSFQNKNNKIKIFILLPTKDKMKSLVQSHYVPKFVNLIINFGTSEITNIRQQYNWRIKKRISQSQSLKYCGNVINLCYSEKEANRLHTLISNSNMKSQVVKIKELKLLSQYTNIGQKQSQKYELEQQQFVEQQRSQEFLKQANQQFNTKWATQIIVSHLSHTPKLKLIKQMVLKNKNIFSSALIYSKNYDHIANISRMIPSQIIRRLVSNQADLPKALQLLQKDEIKILLITENVFAKIRQLEIPLCVDFIINSFIPNQSQELFAHFVKNVTRQEMSKLRPGVVVNFLGENADNQKQFMVDLFEKTGINYVIFDANSKNENRCDFKQYFELPKTTININKQRQNAKQQNYHKQQILSQQKESISIASNKIYPYYTPQVPKTQEIKDEQSNNISLSNQQKYKINPNINTNKSNNIIIERQKGVTKSAQKQDQRLQDSQIGIQNYGKDNINNKKYQRVQKKFAEGKMKKENNNWPEQVQIILDNRAKSLQIIVAEQQKRFTQIIKQILAQNKKQVIQEVKNLTQNNFKQTENIKKEIKSNHSVILNQVKQTIPEKIVQCTQIVLQNLQQQLKSKQPSNPNTNTYSNISQIAQLKKSIQQHNQKMQKQSESINNDIIKATNNIKGQYQQRHRQINLKAVQLQEQQQKSINKLNTKLMSKQEIGVNKQMQIKIKESMALNQKNKELLKQIGILKIQLIKIRKQETWLREQLKKQRNRSQQLVTEVANLSQWKKKYQVNFEMVSSNYAKLQRQNDVLKKKHGQCQQTNNQMVVELARIRKDVMDAKQQIMQIIGLRAQQKTTKNSLVKNIKNTTNQNRLINPAQNQAFKIKEIQNLTIAQSIRKYLNTDKKDYQKLKQILQKAINKTIKKQDTQLMSQMQEFKQLKISLAETCRNLQPTNIFMYFNRIINKLMQHFDVNKLYQIDFIRYCRQLENGFVTLAENLVQTLKSGTQCSMMGILDNNRKQSMVNLSIKTICKNVNQFKIFCNKKVEEFQKVNKQMDDLKNANVIQSQLISKLQASKKQIQTKLAALTLSQTNSQISRQSQNTSQVAKLKQTLLNVRKQLTQKSKNYLENQQSYVNTIDELNRQLQINKKALQKVQKDLESEKKNAISAASQANKQLQKVRKNATESLNKLRLQTSLANKDSILEQKYKKIQQQLIKKYEDELQKSRSQTQKLQLKYSLQISQLSQSLKLEHQSQISRLQAQHNSQLSKSKSQIKPQIKSQVKSAKPVQNSPDPQQEKFKKFLNSLNSTITKLTQIQFTVNFENYQRNLGLFQMAFQEKYGKILFLPSSFMYKDMNYEDKKFVYDNIVRVTNNKIAYTQSLFAYHGVQGDTWQQWRQKIIDRPNLLVLMTLSNGWKIGAFSQNPYSKTDKWQKGKGYIMSITNKKCYDVKKLYYGKVARYALYTLVFGNNELIIQDNLNFSIIMNKMHLHFATQGDRSIDFIGMEETEEGTFTQIEIHQVIFQ